MSAKLDDTKRGGQRALNFTQPNIGFSFEFAEKAVRAKDVRKVTRRDQPDRCADRSGQRAGQEAGGGTSEHLTPALPAWDRPPLILCNAKIFIALHQFKDYIAFIEPSRRV
jgi:hypothetical protein